MAEKRQTSKIFVGGLSWETTDQRLRTYFENYGAVSEAFVSFDRTTGRPRGFGFVVFEDPAVADKVVSAQHTIDRREVEAKKAVPKEDHPASKQPNGLTSQRTKKIFVGGLAPSVDELAFKKYFEQYGAVEDAVVMYDHDNKRPRGFGFVTFVSEDGVDAVFTGGSLQTLHDKPIEIKRAVPRDQIASVRGRSGFAQSPRLFPSNGQGSSAGLSPAQSGFAAAAMGPAFDDGPLSNTMLGSHSLGNSLPQHRSHALSSTASLGAQGLPMYNQHELGALSQGLAAGILNAMSGQLNNQLSSQLSLPNGGGLSTHNNRQSPALAPRTGPVANAAHLSAANSQQLQQIASQQLQHIGSQQLQHMGGVHLQALSSQPLHQLGSSQLQQSSSGVLQGHPYGLPSNGLNASLGSMDILGQDYGRMQNSNIPYNSGSNFVNAKPSSGLESAFANMALEHQASGADLPPATAFEERVNMLSAGSAGLGQLPSPKLTTAFSSSYPDGYAAERLVGQENPNPPAQQW